MTGRDPVPFPPPVEFPRLTLRRRPGWLNMSMAVVCFWPDWVGAVGSGKAAKRVVCAMGSYRCAELPASLGNYSSRVVMAVF